jgi:hypothetical protein
MDKKRFAHIAKWVFLITFLVALFSPAFLPAPWWFVLTVETSLILSVVGMMTCFSWKKERVTDIPDIYILWIVISTMSSGVVCLSASGIMRSLVIVITVLMAIISMIGLVLRTRGKKLEDVLSPRFLSLFFGILWVYMIPFVGVVEIFRNFFAIAWGGVFGLWWAETFSLYFLSDLSKDSF